MSDEPTPPPLRLKPRIRSTPDTPPPAPAAPPPESATVEPAAAAEAPKLRLKPKLAADPVTPAASAPTEPPPVSTSAPARPEPMAPATSATPPAVPSPVISEAAATAEAEAPKFKLKMKPAAASSSAAPVPVPPAAAVAAGEATAASPAGAEAPAPGSAAGLAAEAKAAPAPFSVITNAPRGTKKYPPPVPHLRAPGKVEEPTPPPPPVRKRKAPASGRLVLALVGLVLVAGGYWGYLRLMAPEPPPPPPPTLKPKPTTMPGRAIEKAKEAVAAQRAAEQAPLNEVVDGEESADGKPLQGPKPKAPPPAVVTTQIAPGVTASSASIDVTGNAGLGFRTWVGNVRINGVFQGKTPRALVNGRAYHVGQTVDEPLGIVIAAIDTQAKTILFRDRTGATALRRY